jgi:hypothetical protein
MATFPQRMSTNSPPLSSLPQEPTSDADAAADSDHGSSMVVVAECMLPTLAPNHPVGLGISHASIPNAQAQPSLTVSPSNAPGISESMPHPHLQSQRQQTEVPTTTTGATATTQTQTPKGQDSTEASSSGGGAGPTVTTPEDVSGVNSPAVGTGTAPSGAGSNTGGGASGNGLTTPGAAVGGFMGKLRGLGRTAKRTQGESTPGTPAHTPRAPGSATPGPGTVSSAAAAQPSTPVRLFLSFLPPVREHSHESVFLYNRWYRKRPRNRARPPNSSSLLARSTHLPPQRLPASLFPRILPYSSRRSARPDGLSCTAALSPAPGRPVTWRCWRTRCRCGCWSFCYSDAHSRCPRSSSGSRLHPCQMGGQERTRE